MENKKEINAASVTVGKTQEKVDLKKKMRKKAISPYQHDHPHPSEPMLRGGFISDLDSLDFYEDE